QAVESLRGTGEDLPSQSQVEGQIRLHLEIILDEGPQIAGAVGKLNLHDTYLPCPWVELNIRLEVRIVGSKLQDIGELEGRTPGGVGKVLIVVVAGDVGAELEVLPAARQSRHVLPLIVVLAEQTDEAVARQRRAVVGAHGRHLAM